MYRTVLLSTLLLALSFRSLAQDAPAASYSVAAGGELDMIGGMSYKIPSFGGFVQVHRESPGLINVWNTSEWANDRKAYNTDGWFVSNVSEVGFRASKVFVPTFVSYWGRQVNSSYTKAMLSFGGGLRAELEPGLSIYSEYLAPDVLSFNHAQRVLLGCDIAYPAGKRLQGYVGLVQSMVFFDQPQAGGIAHMTGFEISIRAGIVFGHSGK